MKLLQFILLLVLAVTTANAQGCFQAIQDGQPVQVICAGKPVFFRDCSPNPDPNAVIFYYPGPGEFTGQSNILTGEEEMVYSNSGEYIVTQIINKSGSGGTDFFKQTFQVLASPSLATTALTVTPCANRKVSLSITDNQYDFYTVTYGDGKEDKVEAGAAITHTYSVAGPYTISVVGNFEGASCSSLPVSKTVNELPAYSAPTITNLKVEQQDVSSGSINLSFNNLLPGYSYTISRKLESENSFSEVATLSANQSSFMLANTNTLVKADYRIDAKDACNTSLASSNEVSNIIVDITVTNGQNSVQWLHSGTFQRLQIARNGALLPITNPVNPYRDTDVTCGIEYCYEIRALETDGRATSVSALKCVTAISNVKPAAPYLLSSFNSDNQVELSLKLPDGKEAQKIDIEKSINGTSYQPLATAQKPTYTDAVSDISSFCYRASFTDVCGNTSGLSNISCPIILQAEKLEGGAVKLDWSSYTGFPNGVKQYRVELLDGSGTVVNSYPVNGTTFTDQTLSNDLLLLRYRIRAISGTDNEITFSNTEQVEQEVQLFVPSAFTPNSDGLNDEFVVKGKLFSNFTIRIYNSLGNVVYQSTDATTGWDGTYKGQALPAAAYAYEITVQTSFGVTKRKTGTVTLLR